MSPAPRKSGCQGFSILEAVAGSAILVLALTSVLAVATQGYRYIGDMRRDSRSSQVLQQRLEDIRLMTVWTNILALNNSTFVDTNLPGTVFNGTITVVPYPPYDSFNGSPIVARLTLTVTWAHRSGRVRTNYLSSLVCKDGLNSYIF